MASNDSIPTYRLGDNGVESFLNDEHKPLGEVKSTVKYRYGATPGKGYSATFYRLEEAHGNFIPGSRDTDDASLIVLKIVPKTDSPKRRFKDFEVTLVLESDDCGLNDDPPSLAAFEPAADAEQYFQEHLIAVTKMNTIEGGLSLKPPVGPEPTFSATKATERQYEQRRLLKLSATSFGIDKGVDTEVRFHLQAAVEEDGIGDSLAVALIVKRAPGTSFFIKAVTAANVSYRSRDLLSWTSARKDSELRLGPFGPMKTGEQTGPKGVDKSNLKAASDQALKNLAYVHLPEKGTRKLFLERKEHADAESPTTASSGLIPLEPTLKMLPSTSLVMGDVPTSQEAQNMKVEEVAKLASAQKLAQDEAVNLATPLQRHSSIRPLPQEYRSTLSMQNSRAVRHRMMASLYQNLAQLHLQEAEETEILIEKAHTDADFEE